MRRRWRWRAPNRCRCAAGLSTHRYQKTGSGLANLSMVIRAAGKVAVACTLALALWTGSAQALSLQQIGSFNQPIFLTSDPGNPERLFVAEQGGLIEEVRGEA